MDIQRNFWWSSKQGGMISLFNLDKSKKYMIVGVKKSGTQSFNKFLLNRGYDVECYEGRFTLSEFYTNHDYSRIPLVIIRDPVERAWSDYNYFKDYDPPVNTNGLDDSIDVSDYEKYLKFWDCIVYKLEDLMLLPDFPKENENTNKKVLTQSKRDEIQNKLGVMN